MIPVASELGFPLCSEDQVAVEQHHHIDGDQRTVDQAGTG